jgi:hypothetical protein
MKQNGFAIYALEIMKIKFGHFIAPIAIMIYVYHVPKNLCQEMNSLII